MDQEFKYNIRETGQIRRAKMHLSNFIDQIERNKAFTPFLKKLLETSFILQTTNILVIANHLKYSPATIRSGFQQIFTILGEHSKHRIFQIIKEQTLQDTLH